MAVVSREYSNLEVVEIYGSCDNNFFVLFPLSYRWWQSLYVNPNQIRDLILGDLLKTLLSCSMETNEAKGSGNQFWNGSSISCGQLLWDATTTRRLLWDATTTSHLVGPSRSVVSLS